MRPKTLSASSTQVYESCPARWKAEYFEKGESVGGSAANLGTVCHEVLEQLVKLFVVADAPIEPNAILVRDIYDVAYEKHFADRKRYTEGLDLCQAWFTKNFPWDKNLQVLSTEEKRSFQLPLGDGTFVDFNYIMDRMDKRLDDGSIEVVDYKSVAAPIQPDDLKEKLQARSYGLAAQLEFPEAPFVRVTFDLLRYEPVGVRFTKEENRDTWNYLKRLAARILADEEAPERLNEECRWCIRRHVCTVLRSHMDVGGVQGISSPTVAAVKLAEYDLAVKALQVNINDLSDLIIQHCEREDELGFETDKVKVDITASKRRWVDPDAAKRILDPKFILDHASIGVTALDEILKDPSLTDEERSEIKQLIFVKFGNPKVKTKLKHDI